jgi:(p)ppGpp synthase/HD superfamily hydrolase
MDVFEKAVIFAVKAHNGKTRKIGDLPYVIHPLEASVIASGITADREVLAAALLHDTIEDTPTTMEELQYEFGERVAALVASETENKRKDLPPEESWYIRKAEAIEVLKNSDDIGVKIIWLADKLSNMRSFYRIYKTQGNNLWNRFHQNDPSKQAWYYRSVAENTKELCETDAWKEYSKLIEIIFEGVE